MIKNIIAAKDQNALMSMFSKIIHISYGEKSPDGKHFVKSEELATAFEQTLAYDNLFMDLINDADKAAAFVDMMMTRNYYTQEDLKDQSKVAEKVEANIMKLAKEAGLDTDKLKADMKNEVVSRELANVRELAQRFEINGTPFLVIGEQAFPGAIPYDQIMNALDK